MARRPPTSLLADFGMTVELEELYWHVHVRTGDHLDLVARDLDRTPDELRSALRPLVAAGAVTLEGDVLRVPPLVQVVSRLLSVEVERAADAVQRLRGLAGAVPYLQAAPAEVASDAEPLSGHRWDGGSPPDLMAQWIAESTGELRWMRPDQWRRPTPEVLMSATRDAVASGRSSRALYPVRALDEAGEELAERARMGEQIRVLPEVPTRLFVVGTTHALVPHLPGFESTRRLVVRERGLVLMLGQLFESIWEKAEPVPSLDLPGGRERSRRLLLRQLADGAGDEQIARALGISLRTVRRRVADVLIELGADTRFQAGVEAVRRGWL